MIITPPSPSEYPERFAEEIQWAKTMNLIDGLENEPKDTVKTLTHLEKEQLLHRYEPGKWTIMEMWQHHPTIPDMRTAAYVVAINKVGTAYAELGIFP